MIKRFNKECYLTDTSTPYIAFDVLENIDCIKAGFSTRLGGVSTGYLSSLNLGYDLGDTKENIIENYTRIAGELGFDINNVVMSVQVHKADVVEVDSDDRGHGLTRPFVYESADGLITDESDVVLTVRGADCTPMFLVDPVKKVIATAHGGWAGTVNNIAGNAINKMVNKYGCDVNDIIAVIGPSICPDCYEISSDVADKFIDSFGNQALEELDVSEDYINKRILTPGDDNHYQANLWLANRQKMIDAGVKKENIHNSCLCTKCNMDLFYSHRGMQGKRGVMSGFMYIK